MNFTLNIPEIIINKSGLYEGDLVHYGRIIFEAPNIYHGYHGLRHMLHVMWFCYEACDYYNTMGDGTMGGYLSSRRMRNLLIAALFHDYRHCGKSGDDRENIERAVLGLQEHILPEDKPWLDDIIGIIKATQFPHLDLPDSQLEHCIIRDADMSQVFHTAWIGEIVAGFGSELGKSPVEMLKQQLKFLENLKFHSSFGQVHYGDEAIQGKISETKGLLDILSQ